MSRLTASPFHKPSSFVFPREPISPPETLLTDAGYPVASVTPPLNSDLQREGRNEEPLSFNHTDTPPHSRPTRPSISYQNSGFRDTPSRSVHRSYRFFVVVTPPQRLINQHGQLGHTLASGPSHRLSQGIIMPLFPTMYAQLMAIAKEFNFPSTAGLCLYLHVNESGVVMTPRISDESWHMLWSHLFDMPSIPRGPPIGGKIEFDIDYQQARWYSSWLSTSLRDHVERPFSHIPSGAPSIVAPVEARDSVDGDFLRDSDHHENSQPHHRSSSHSRHVPRKLSLVERFDIPVSRPESRAGSAQTLRSPDQGIPIPKALSPIAQESEPRTAREQLDSRVNTWRASAVTKPSSLAARGQTSLEPFNLPNNVNLDDEIPASASIELNLDDFTWSISSAGPGDSEFMSLGSPSERLPSPDMGRRMLEDSPPTPTTATSWGAPLSYPPSPISDYRPPSLDLAFRSIFSPPMTPATATSWGPASPTSSIGWYQDAARPRSIHLGERGDFSRPVTPSTATSWGAPLSYPPTPSTPFYVQTPDVAKRSFDLAQEHAGSMSSGQPWNFVWPLLNANRVVPANSSTGTQPWRFVWPYLTTQQAISTTSPRAQPWSYVWPYFDSQESMSISTEVIMQASGYPFLSIYPPVYPHFDLYAAAAAATEQKVEASTPIKVTLDSPYPSLQIYTPVYPHNLIIYPEVRQPKEELAPVVVTLSQYPSFNMYPVVYPYFDLYPAPTLLPLAPSVVSEAKLSSYGVYPNLVIYSAVYPHFDIYPAKAAETITRKPESTLTQIKVTLSAQYPIFNIYPALYPQFEIYPAKAVETVAKDLGLKDIEVSLSAQYPMFNIYPAVYPNLDIYPSLSVQDKELVARAPSSISVSQSQYPIFDLYPAVYPCFNIYPPKAGMIQAQESTQQAVIIKSDPYPIIRPYPAVYPYFELYPSIESTVITPQTEDVKVLLSDASGYPTFEIYPAVYPHFSLYPPAAGQTDAVQQTEAQGRVASQYPYLQIYEPVYPHLSIYPPMAASLPQAEDPVFTAIDNVSTAATPLTRRPHKSHHDLHEEVFHCLPVRTPSGTGMITRPEADLRPLNVPQRHNPRRITSTRSPTGPAFHRSDAPPALPSPSRKLPSPPPLANGTPRSPSVMEQMAGFRAEARRYSPTAPRPPSSVPVTSTKRASMISPLRQMPIPRSADPSSQPGDLFPPAPSSGLNRARSVGNATRPLVIKPRIRDSFFMQRRD